MNSNVGGILVLAVAVFLIGMGIFGSQHDLFPGLFGATANPGAVGKATDAITQALSPTPSTGHGTPPNCPKGSVAWFDVQTNKWVCLIFQA